MPPGDDLVRQVEDALEHLYDYVYLQSHPLTEWLQPGSQLAPRERMRALRMALLEAIEDLRPDPAVPPGSLPARTYNVLNLRYVAGLTVEAVARELAISERQVYRDLRKAEQDLASLLASGRGVAPEPPPAAEPSTEQLVLREAQRLRGEAEDLPVQALLQGALAAVERLAQQLGVHLEARLPERPQVIRSDRALARQALVSVLSSALQCAAAGTAVMLISQPLGVRVRIQVACTPRDTPDPDLCLAAEQIVKHLGGQWSVTARAGGEQIVTLTLGETGQPTLLVIDDNEGLHELFRRYLADEDYRLLAAGGGREGLNLAEEVAPDLIVLDVMMPQEDGWEVLQALRSRESTREIPVIVCSVLRDPQLALSLGAAGFLAKPVSRTQLLQAVARCRQGPAR